MNGLSADEIALIGSFLLFDDWFNFLLSCKQVHRSLVSRKFFRPRVEVSFDTINNRYYGGNGRRCYNLKWNGKYTYGRTTVRGTRVMLTPDSKPRYYEMCAGEYVERRNGITYSEYIYDYISLEDKNIVYIIDLIDENREEEEVGKEDIDELLRFDSPMEAAKDDNFYFINTSLDSEETEMMIYSSEKTVNQYQTIIQIPSEIKPLIQEELRYVQMVGEDNDITLEWV